MINEFIIRDVRCFAGEQRLRIRPLTFIVGENSTGKSTVLGCMQALANTVYASNVNFNSHPYQMGAFSDIIRRKNGEEPGRKKFLLGQRFRLHGDLVLDSLCEFKEQGSEPVMATESIVFPDGGKIIIEPRPFQNAKDFAAMLFVGVADIEKRGSNAFVIKPYLEFFNESPFFRPLEALRRTLSGRGRQQDKPRIEEYRRFLKSKLQISEKQDFSHLGLLEKQGAKYVSVAPVRAKPQRTYDPLTEELTPEGGDVPMFLMRLKRTGDPKGKQMEKALAGFGGASGMFDAIKVHTYGKGMNEPFQLRVRKGGVESNILDVGYGVSQILPILVRIFSAPKTTFLLQQPEVHLHPRAQAELASLFAASVKERGQKFIIETHTDYIVNRAGIEIRRKNISCDDVSLIYMEPKNGRVVAHNIRFDDSGNLLDVPQGYRRFFLNESDRFLGFKD